MAGIKIAANVIEEESFLIPHHDHNHQRYLHHFTTPHGRDPKLHFYLQLAHKGSGVGKIQHYAKRIYRHGHYNEKPRGVHDYQNLGWDPSIYRGRTFKDFRTKNLPAYSSVINANNYCCSESQLKKSKKASAPISKARRVSKQKMGGILKVDDMIAEDSAIHSRNRHHIDSKSEMLAFIIEQADMPEYRDNLSQSDAIRSVDSPFAVQPPRCLSLAIGENKSNQANIGYVGTATKEDPIEPLVSQVGSKILQQSLMETFEEYEIGQIQLEMGVFIDKKRAREARMSRVVDHELTMMALRRKEKTLREKEEKFNAEAEEYIGVVVFASQYCGVIIQRTFETLRSTNFYEALGDNFDKHMRPWFNDEAIKRIDVSRMVLNSIISNSLTPEALSNNDKPLSPPADPTNQSIEQE